MQENELTEEMKSILDERLLEDQSEYMTGEESIQLLKEKYSSPDWHIQFVKDEIEKIKNNLIYYWIGRMLKEDSIFNVISNSVLSA